MVNLLNLVVITNLFLYLLTTWKIHLLIPQVPHLFTPAGSCESLSQAWVARSAYLSRFIRAKSEFIIKDHLLWHCGRDKGYLLCIVNKWLKGDQQFMLENEESLPSVTAGLDPLCSGMHITSSWNNCWLPLLPTHQSAMEMMLSWCLHFN